MAADRALSRARVTSERVSPVVSPGRPRLSAAGVSESAAPAPKRKDHRRTFVLAALVAPLIAINILGARYYLAPVSSRVRDPLHVWLRPSGYIGQSAGIVALLIFFFLWLYPLRKKWKALAFTGSVGKWLDVHVTSALILPLLLAVHASWRSDGVIGLGLVAMLVVIASGVVGRYLYTRIPRAKSGVELTRDEVAAKRKELMERLSATTGLSTEAVERALDTAPEQAGHESPFRVLQHLLTNDLLRWRRTRALRQRWAALAPDSRPLGPQALREAVRLAGREISLVQQTRMLEATHRVFRYWHVAHRPFAITALAAVLIHVVVVVAVGATWFR